MANPAFSLASQAIYEHMMNVGTDYITVKHHSAPDFYASLTISKNSDVNVFIYPDNSDGVTLHLQYCVSVNIDIKTANTKMSLKSRGSMLGDIKAMLCDIFLFASAFCVDELYVIFNNIINDFIQEDTNYTAWDIADALYDTSQDCANIHFESSDKLLIDTLRKIRYEDMRGICMGFNNNDIHSAVELTYNINERNNITILYGMELSYLNFTANGKPYHFDLTNETTAWFKTGTLLNMFAQLGTCPAADNDIIEEASFTFQFGNKDLKVFAQLCDQIKYDTQVDVQRRIVYEDGYYSIDVSRDSSTQALAHQVNTFRNQLLYPQASLIQAAFKAWQVRKEYAWNPETTLGRFYVMREFDNLINSNTNTKN